MSEAEGRAIEYLEPSRGLVGVEPRRWETCDVVGPATVDLHFIGSPHRALARVARVDLEDRPDVVVATLYTGNDPAARGAYTLVGTACAVRVELPSPLAGRRVVDGWPIAVARSRVASWRACIERLEAGEADAGLDDVARIHRDEVEQALNVSAEAERQRLLDEVSVLDERFREATVPAGNSRSGGEAWWWTRRSPSLPPEA